MALLAGFGSESEINPVYLPPRTLHDIALIKLCKHAEFSPVIDTIGLPRPNTDLSTIENVTVAGWGRTKEKGRVSRNALGRKPFMKSKSKTCISPWGASIYYICKILGTF